MGLLAVRLIVRVADVERVLDERTAVGVESYEIPVDEGNFKGAGLQGSGSILVAAKVVHVVVDGHEVV
jgi:hypothetical protein